jgi:hypothetical protein
MSVSLLKMNAGHEQVTVSRCSQMVAASKVSTSGMILAMFHSPM